jgi:hypothetical protein
MYLGSWKIDDYVPIPVTTHKFSTGAAFAPSALTYSIYEDAGTTGIVEDVDMVVASPFDSVVGFYLARPQLTTAAGYEKGKNYTVLIKATVDSVAAITSHTFQIEAEVDANSVPSTLALEATLDAIKGAGWTTETLKQLSTDIAGISAGGGSSSSDIWTYASRTLTQSATSIISAVTGSSISDVRGSSWSIQITDLTLDSNKQQFMIKRRTQDPDSDALLLVDSATGLKTLNGVSTGLTAADATLVYVGTTLTLTVKASVTAQLPEGTQKYGIQYVTAAALVEEPYGGNFTITADVVRLTA